MHWGEMARKGGVPPDRVLDAMRLAKLLRHLRRGGKPPAARLAGQVDPIIKVGTSSHCKSRIGLRASPERVDGRQRDVPGQTRSPSRPFNR
jgi:hypothetical protein